MKKTMESSIQHAFFKYVANCLASGNIADIDDLEARGLTQTDFSFIENLSTIDIEKIAEINSDFLEFKFNSEKFLVLMADVRDIQAVESLKKELVIKNAPTAMMKTLYKTTSDQFSALRKRYGLSGKSGRPPAGTEEEEQKVWAAIRLLDLEPMAPSTLKGEDYLTLCNNTQVDLRVIWRLIQEWDADL